MTGMGFFFVIITLMRILELLEARSDERNLELQKGGRVREREGERE